MAKQKLEIAMPFTLMMSFVLLRVGEFFGHARFPNLTISMISFYTLLTLKLNYWMEPLPIRGADSKLHPVAEPPSGETDYNIVFVVWPNATDFHVGHLPCTSASMGISVYPIRQRQGGLAEQT